MKFFITFSALLLYLPLNSCTTTQKMSDNQRERGHYTLYSFPEKLTPSNESDRYKKIVFVSSNNFAGHIWPEHVNIPNKFKEKREVSVGGVAAMKAYSDVFKEVFENKVLFIDSGSFINPGKDINKTIFYYNYLNPDVMSLASGEFSLDVETNNYLGRISRITNKLKPNVITSNLFDLENAKRAEIRNVAEHTTKIVNDVKIGFISTLSESMIKALPQENFNGLYIQNSASSIITKAEELRRAGSKIIVLLTNSTIDCNTVQSDNNDLPIDKVNFEPKNSKYCLKTQSDLYKILSQLPKQTIDLVITSDGTEKTANFIQDIPVIQNPGKGQFYSWIELTFDTKLQVVVEDETELHQPVMLCHQFLKDSQDCYLKEKLSDKEVIPATFLGKEIKIFPLPTI